VRFHNGISAFNPRSEGRAVRYDVNQRYLLPIMPSVFSNSDQPNSS
jgi:hypothetical protein